MTATTGGSWSTGSAPEVRVAGGALLGTLESGVAAFRGVRYAEPPVGELRSAAPRPAWRSSRSCSETSPAGNPPR
jgi:para-nitrobenzyl esterase